MSGRLIFKASCFGLGLMSTYAAIAGAMGDVQEGKRFFFSAGAVYGNVSDGTLDKLQYVDTIKATGQIATELSDVDAHVGYSLSAGFLFGPQNSHDVVLSYTNLHTNGATSVANLDPADSMKIRLSPLVLDFSGQQLDGVSAAAVSAHYQYQTADLVMHRNYVSSFVNQVRFAPFFGIKATDLQKGFNASYSGRSFIGVGVQPLNDQISYEAEYYGIGPKIGTGAFWDFNSIFSIGGTLDFSILAGTRSSRFNEVLITGPSPIFGLPPTEAYAYSQNYPNSLWIAPVLGASLAINANFDLNSGNRIGLSGGISSEQYWSEATTDSFSRAHGENTINVNQRFSVRRLIFTTGVFPMVANIFG